MWGHRDNSAAATAAVKREAVAAKVRAAVERAAVASATEPMVEEVASAGRGSVVA